MNLDLNSGNPIGFGIPSSTAYNGERITAASAFLIDKLDNLRILTDKLMTRVLFESRKAIGVKSAGETCKLNPVQSAVQNFSWISANLIVVFASKGVILSAGALDMPKIMLLSGIGPAKELEELNIPVVQDLPAVGRNLRDHW